MKRRRRRRRGRRRKWWKWDAMRATLSHAHMPQPLTQLFENGKPSRARLGHGSQFASRCCQLIVFFSLSPSLSFRHSLSTSPPLLTPLWSVSLCLWRILRSGKSNCAVAAPSQAYRSKFKRTNDRKESRKKYSWKNNYLLELWNKRSKARKVNGSVWRVRKIWCHQFRLIVFHLAAIVCHFLLSCRLALLCFSICEIRRIVGAGAGWNSHRAKRMTQSFHQCPGNPINWQSDVLVMSCWSRATTREFQRKTK